MASENLMEKLSDLKTASGPSLIELPGWTLNLENVQADSLSCRANGLTLRSNRREANLSNTQVKTWANSVAIKVTGLLEPLRVLEVDETDATALLRSDKPSAKANEVTYYEVILKADRTANLQRYRGFTQETKPRVQIPFTVTHEVLAKFVEDVIG